MFKEELQINNNKKNDLIFKEINFGYLLAELFTNILNLIEEYSM